ncbi:MAG: hypothetical protein RSB82_03245 [Victivallaceae bacterium]
MKAFIKHFFLKNWLQKIISLGFAIIIWFLVNQTITDTRSIGNVPVRIINLLPDQTVIGLLPNGLLKQRVLLTVTGNKSFIADLRSSDLEIVINTSSHDQSWIASIDKRHLISLNPDLDLKNQLHQIVADDIVINLTRLVTEEIPLTISAPIGAPPKGYQYLDVWPKFLKQKVSGPEESVKALQERGLEVTFNLNKISSEELDHAYEKQDHRDEIFFKVPDGWKKVAIPFEDVSLQNFNDPQAEFLRLLFLKQEFMPIGIKLPIILFFPIKYSELLNPQTFYLEPNPPVYINKGIYQLNTPLFVKDVSRLFLDVVKNNLAIAIVMSPSEELSQLEWAVEFMDEKALENAFVEAVAEQESRVASERPIDEQLIRHRFREYLRRLTVFNENGTPLNLRAIIRGHKVSITLTEGKNETHFQPERR